MKRAISILLSVTLLLFLLSACQAPAAGPDQVQPSEPPASSTPVELSCMDLMVHISLMLGNTPFDGDGGEVYGNPEANDRDQLSAYIKGAYGLDEGEWQDAYIFRAVGAYAGEIAILCFEDENAAQRGEDCLKDYLHSREGDFTGYAPDQAKLVANAEVCRRGSYVGLFICSDSALARSTFTTMVETGELPEPPGPIEDVGELIEVLLSVCEDAGDDVSAVERVDGADPDKLRAIIDDTYGLKGCAWEEAAIVRGTDGSVFELAVLRMADERASFDATEILVRDYLDVKEEEYARFPVQAELLGRAVAIKPHDFNLVILAVCSNPDQIAGQVVESLATDGHSGYLRHLGSKGSSAECDPDYPARVKFVEPQKEDMSIYDTAAIRAAWGKGDPAGLSDGDQEVYGAAKEILGELLQEGMTDIEKETAVYNWLVNNVNYDWRHQDVMAETPRISYQPYGGLVAREAVCLGYATSFQLLMDLAGVECITVVGACFNSEEDHAWNMVRLDGEWYCVDVTWDANGREQLGTAYEWRYFNVTSDEMAKNHQWDYANTPESTAQS